MQHLFLLFYQRAIPTKCLESKHTAYCIYTHIAQEIDERIVAAVRHGQHVAAKPDHIDVLVTEKNIHQHRKNIKSSIFMYK